MEIKNISSGIKIYFPQKEKETAEIIENACNQSVSLINEMWGLALARTCHLYVMTSCPQFILLSAPWPFRLFYAFTFPLWFFHVQRVWSFSGGWFQRYRKKLVIGIKSIGQLAKLDTSIGKKIFVDEDDLRKKLENIACHEITHAFSCHLKLPLWLNEGIAMVTVDALRGKPTVKNSSLDLLKPAARQRAPLKYRKILNAEKDVIAYHYARGYWITRFLLDTQSGLMKEVLNKKLRYQQLEKMIASGFNTSTKNFWRKIDQMVIEHFKGTSSLH